MINGYKTGFYAAGTFAQLPIEETCGILKNIGYDAVELGYDWFEKCGSAEALRRDIEKIEMAGMILSECLVQQDYIAKDLSAQTHAIGNTKRAICLCADAGIETLNLYSGPRQWIADRLTVGDNISQGQAWSIVFRAFDELVPLAEEKGVALAIENVWGMLCCDFYTASYLVNHYNSPCLGVNFDPSHDQLKGNTDMEFMIRQWGKDRIKHVHMKDAAGSQERGKVLFLPLGTGLVDWDGVVRGLDAIGYEGVLSVEYEAAQHLERNLKGDWVRAAGESFDALKAILEK